jgi:hypothetical protein
MSQQRTGLLVFLRGLASPVVLYGEDPTALYEDLKNVMRQCSSTQPKLIERSGTGPLGKVVFLDTELVGCALQNEASGGA